MFKALINGLFSVVLSLVQVILYPFNQLINATFPDFTEKIQYMVGGINNALRSFLTWLNILPAPLLETLTFILTIEILLFTIGIVIFGVQKSLGIIQKIKFW